MREITDETAVEVAEADERLHLFDIARFRPLGDSTDLDRVHTDVSLSDHQPQVLDRRPLELALLWLQVQLILAENPQDFACDPTVLLRCSSSVLVKMRMSSR